MSRECFQLPNSHIKLKNMKLFDDISKDISQSPCTSVIFSLETIYLIILNQPLFHN